MKKIATLKVALLLLVSCQAATANAEIVAIAPTTYGRIYLTDNEGGCTRLVGIPTHQWRRLQSTTDEGRNTGGGCWTLTDKSVVVRWDDGGPGIIPRERFEWLKPQAGAP